MKAYEYSHVRILIIIIIGHFEFNITLYGFENSYLNVIYT